MVTMKGLPMTYNRDMQEDKEPLFEAADQLCGSLEMARVVIESAKLHPAKPLAAAEESWVVATDLAEALARAGTPFHQAHQIVGRLVLESVRGRQQARRLDAPKSCSAFAPEFTRRYRARCSIPTKGMKSREIAGRHRARSPWPPRSAGARRRARPDDAYEQKLPPGPDPKLIRSKTISHPGRTGAGAEEASASPPRR